MPGAKVTIGSQYISRFGIDFEQTDDGVCKCTHRFTIRKDVSDWLEAMEATHGFEYGWVVLLTGYKPSGIRFNFDDVNLALLFKLRFGGL